MTLNIIFSDMINEKKLKKTLVKLSTTLMSLKATVKTFYCRWRILY